MIFDARGKEITPGLYVRYIDTGTISEVVDTKVEDNVSWVKLKKTDLWYVSKYIEVLDQEDLKIKLNQDDDKDDEIDIETLKELKEDLENIELDSNVAEGGG